MKKSFAMLVALAVSIIPFVFAGFLIHNTGEGILLLLYVIPLLIFISSLIYGKHYKFDLIYVLLLTGLVFLVPVTLFSPDMYIYTIIYGTLTLAGNSIGSAFHKDAKNSKVWKIILGVVLALLVIILFLYTHNIFSIKNQDPYIAQNNSYPKNTVQFQITNLSENTLDKITIVTNEEGKCALRTKTITLKKDETKTLWKDFGRWKSLNCNLASEGNYILSYEKKGTKNSYGFGYYTNYMPTYPFFTLIINQNGDIKINEKNFLEKEERIITKGITEKDSPVIVEQILDTDAKYLISHSDDGDIIDYAVQYDAGEYQGEESLTFSNKKANEIRDKVDRKNNPFYQNWKHDRGVHQSKKYGSFDITQVDGEDGYLQYIVKKDNKQIYISTKTIFRTDYPLKNFVVNGDDWWLFYDENQRSKNPLLSHINYHSRLIHNGEEVKNADTFALHNIDGKVLYFFQKDKNSKIQYYFDGKIYDTDFDEIIHDRCCEYGAYNMRISTDGRLAFWGVTGKQFTYNEMLLPGSKMNREALNKNKEQTE